MVGIISDIHGNLPALEAVFERMDEIGVERVLCAGDVVGYGANPVECIEEVGARAEAVVRGNHEVAVICEGGAAFFNRVAREACLWTKKQLGPSEIAFIDAMPLVRRLDDMSIVLVHADLAVPGLFDYIQGFYDASGNMELLKEGEVCFFGHSHAPFVFYEGAEGLEYSLGGEVSLEAGARALVNVGSVGQPRDGDTRASFATYEVETRRVTIHRIWYDVLEAGRRITEAGLPRVLADRLRIGR